MKQDILNKLNIFLFNNLLLCFEKWNFIIKCRTVKVIITVGKLITETIDTYKFFLQINNKLFRLGILLKLIFIKESLRLKKK